MEVHPSNPSTWEVGTECLGIQSYLQLHNELKTNMNNIRPYFKKGQKNQRALLPSPPQ